LDLSVHAPPGAPLVLDDELKPGGWVGAPPYQFDCVASALGGCGTWALDSALVAVDVGVGGESDLHWPVGHDFVLQRWDVRGVDLLLTRDCDHVAEALLGQRRVQSAFALRRAGGGGSSVNVCVPVGRPRIEAVGDAGLVLDAVGLESCPWHVNALPMAHPFGATVALHQLLWGQLGACQGAVRGNAGAVGEGVCGRECPAASTVELVSNGQHAIWHLL